MALEVCQAAATVPVEDNTSVEVFFLLRKEIEPVPSPMGHHRATAATPGSIDTIPLLQKQPLGRYRPNSNPKDTVLYCKLI